MLILRRFFLLLLFPLLTSLVYAQERELNFMNLSSRDGLSSNIVSSILKDRYGYMWFGTDDGLNKFDGQQFTVYRHDEDNPSSIASNEILDLFEDEKGNLWIGTGSGITLYNRRMDCFVNYTGVVNGPIISILARPDNKLWLGTYTGLVVFDPRAKKTSLLPVKRQRDREMLANPVPRIFKDSNNRIWIGTGSGLYLYLPDRQIFKQYIHSAQNETSIADNDIRCFAEDRKGNVWIGTNNGLSMLMPDGEHFVNYRYSQGNPHTLSSNIVYTLAADKEGKLWIGTEEGLNILNPETKFILRVEQNPRIKYSITGKAVKSILIDRDDIYWVGTFRGGINKYDKNLPFFNLRRSNPFDPLGLSAPVVTSFVKVANSGMYVGTDGGGLNYYDQKTGFFRRVPFSDKGQGRAILALEDVGSELWVGTYLDGLFIYDTRNGSSRHIVAGAGPQHISGNDIFCIRRDSRGNVWVGTNGQGVDMYDVSRQEFFSFSKNNKTFPPNGYIRAIEEDKEGNILIGTSGSGIFVYNPISQKSYILNKENSKLPKDNINTLCIGSDGTLWAGMTEGGLARFNPAKKQFESYSEKDGLANEVIYKIIEDNSGNIWMSTNKGISSFDPRNRKFRNYSHYNGLQRSPFVLGAGLKLPDGTLFFGGTDGFNYVNPANLHTSKNTPRVVFTDLKISNKTVIPGEDAEINEHISVAKEIDLDYKQNFSLSFAALNFTSPQENRYMYKLEKFDKDWNYVGTVNTAGYTNLDPGKYTFYVRAISENGDWQSPVTAIKINVHPPFWLTYYAYFLYFLLIGSILWYVRRRGIQKLEARFALEQERLQVQQMIEQERREAERLHEFDELKIKFLTNLSHEFRTPISLIMGPVEQLLQVETSNSKSSHLSMIRRNARRLLNLVNQLLDFRNMEDKELRLNEVEGDFIAFARDVAESFKDLSERKQINFEFQSPMRSYFTTFDHDKMERILFNLLSNAFKFTLKGGSVSFKIDRANQDSGLRLRLADTGIGIDPEAREKIFERFFQSDASSSILNQGSGIGLSITKEFVNLHGGTIEVESIKGKGTTFTIYFPFSCIETIDDSETDNSDALEERPEKIDEKSYSQLPVVLLVEDNDDFRFYLKDNLKTYYRIVEAGNGKEGWQKVLSSHPQLVVSDISMPYASGIDLCKKIKSDKRTSHIPVLLLTALTGEEDQLLGLETGANDYMTKPFNFEILNIKIRNLLSLNEKLKSTYSKQIKVLGPEIQIESDNEKLLSKVIQHIEANLTNPQLSVTELSRTIGMSRGSLYSKILELTGETPVEFIRSVKLDRAALLLEKSDMNVAQVCYSVGFATPNYFARAFKTRFNMLPSEYINLKRGGREVEHIQ